MRALKWLIAIPLPLLCFFGGSLFGGLIMFITGALLGTFIQDPLTVYIVVVAGVIGFAIGGLMLGMFLAVRLLEPSKDPNACEECGYNLTGNVSGVCPECGTRIRLQKISDE